MQVFDRRLLRQRRDRAASTATGHDFLFAEAAGRLVDRLGDLRRHFRLALDLGSHTGRLGAELARAGNVDRVVQADLSLAMASRAAHPAVVGDEEALPFRPDTFDAVLSCLSLHWVNDLPGALLQIRQSLKPDGLFLAVMFGGETLTELRESLLWAESEVEGGGSPRVSPFARLNDIAGLLLRAGFALPVADMDRLTVTYPDALHLMADLRATGESNVLHDRRRTLMRRETLAVAVSHYKQRFADNDRVPATFQLLYLTGWAPHPAQQRALRPGGAQARLADALETTEMPAGERAAPEN